MDGRPSSRPVATTCVGLDDRDADPPARPLRRSAHGGRRAACRPAAKAPCPAGQDSRSRRDPHGIPVVGRRWSLAGIDAPIRASGTAGIDAEAEAERRPFPLHRHRPDRAGPGSRTPHPGRGILGRMATGPGAASMAPRAPIGAGTTWRRLGSVPPCAPSPRPMGTRRSEGAAGRPDAGASRRPLRRASPSAAVRRSLRPALEWGGPRPSTQLRCPAPGRTRCRRSPAPAAKRGATPPGTTNGSPRSWWRRMGRRGSDVRTRRPVLAVPWPGRGSSEPSLLVSRRGVGEAWLALA